MSITSSPSFSTGLNLNRNSGMSNHSATRKSHQKAIAKADSFSKASQPHFKGKFQNEPLFLGNLFSFFTTPSPTPREMVWLLADEPESYNELKETLENSFEHVGDISADKKSGKTLAMTALAAKNYQGALLLASFGANPTGQYDNHRQNALDYVDRDASLTTQGKKLLREKLVELYDMRTTVQFHPRLQTERDGIPAFVSTLPRVSSL